MILAIGIGIGVLAIFLAIAMYYSIYIEDKKEPVYEWVDLPKTDIREIELSTYTITVTQQGGEKTVFDWAETSKEARLYADCHETKTYETSVYNIYQFVNRGLFHDSPGVIFLSNIIKIEYVKKSSVKAESYTRKSIRIPKDV